jgi:hypothetical protein
VVEEQPGNIVLRVFRFLFGPPRLNPSLVSDRDVLFCVAKCGLDHSDTVAERILQTIYQRLTGSCAAPVPSRAQLTGGGIGCATGARQFMPSTGPHWDAIGFQGADPATDLRGVGVLGLLQLLYLVTRHADAALDMYRLSRHTRQVRRRLRCVPLHAADVCTAQQFPFCVASLSMTRLALQTLREGRLNKEANRRGSVVDAVMLFYAGAYARLCAQWCALSAVLLTGPWPDVACRRRGALTISDFGPTLQSVSAWCRANPTAVIEALLASTATRGTDKSAQPSEDTVIEFNS